jgi:uncharacterized protein (TIGR02145 family)
MNMRNTISIAAATLGLAITLTLSCSGGDDGGNEPSSGSVAAISSSSDGGGNPSSSSSGGGGSGLTGTSGTFTDSRDNKPYKWVKIGEQYWMAENLNYDVPSNDTDVCYEYATANCTTYGKLYDWATALAACPTGWHLPSDAEWTTLTDYVGSSTAGTKLKANSVLWSTNTGTDEFGFSALPGGDGSDGDFYGAGSYGDWWSATERGASDAWARLMSYYYANVLRDNRDKKTSLFSVRCIKDNN